MNKAIKLSLLFSSMTLLCSCEIMPYFYGTGTKVYYKTFKEQAESIDTVIYQKAFVSFKYIHKENGVGTGFSREIEATWDSSTLSYTTDSQEDQIVVDNVIEHVRQFALYDEPPSYENVTYSYYINPFRVVIDQSQSSGSYKQTGYVDYRFTVDGWVSSFYQIYRSTHPSTEEEGVTIKEETDISASVRYMNTSN